MSTPDTSAPPAATNVTSVADAQADLGRRFAAAGIDSARIDARLLIAGATGQDLTALATRPDQTLTPCQQRMLECMAARRLAREPVSRILGRRGFYGLDLAISPATLDPRPETETLVDEVLGWVRRQMRPDWTPTILDLGTGSGAILLALLANLPTATGIGTDTSADALEIAAANAGAYRLAHRARFQVSDWLDDVSGRFDIVVSNPPYIADNLLSGLDPEVALHDPREALSGGSDGLAAYRRIVARLGQVLSLGGLVALEIGHDQADAVSALLRHAMSTIGPCTVRVVHDLAGRPRCVVATT